MEVTKISHCLYFVFTLYFLFLLFIFVDITSSHQKCSLPDVPSNGYYLPNDTKFQIGKEVTYKCAQNFILIGNEKSKCKSYGDWSSPTPFCDRKAQINKILVANNGQEYGDRRVADGNTTTCSSINSGGYIRMFMDKARSVSAVRIFFAKGTKIQLIIGAKYYKIQEVPTNKWHLILCPDSPLNQTVRIQDKSDNRNISVCEIEIYLKEGGCENPPGQKVANGYINVTRSSATLFCEDGYEIGNNKELTCQRNKWIGILECKEILCNPEVDTTLGNRGEWTFLDTVSKLSNGTRRKLKCNDGYKKVGEPDSVVCQTNGTWTKTNATCEEVENYKGKIKKIILIVAFVVALIIIILLTVIIYFVKKQRKEVVVVYQTQSSMTSVSEPEYATPAYYETVQYYAPQPPTTARPTAQVLGETYLKPVDSYDSPKMQPVPPDIVFGMLKQSTLYRC